MSKEIARWRNRPAREDFAAARNYLSLQFPAALVSRLIDQARRARCLERAAKDLLRASNLPILPSDDPQVAADLKRIHKGKPLSPVVLVQGDAMKGRPLIIADGYHRVCAACHVSENIPVAAVMIEP
jgi:hypothetical protein